MRSPHRPWTPVEDPLQTTVEVDPEFLVRRARGRGECPHDHPAPGWEIREACTAQLAQPSYNMVATDRVADGPTDDEADPGRLITLGGLIGKHDMDDHGRGADAAPTARDVAQLDAAAEAM